MYISYIPCKIISKKMKPSTCPCQRCGIPGAPDPAVALIACDH